MKKYLLYTFSFFVAIQLISCKCGTIECSGFKTAYQKFIPSFYANELLYTNGIGDTILFKKYASYKTVGSSRNCPGSPLSGGCTPCECAVPRASVHYETNDTLRAVRDLNNVIIFQNSFLNIVCNNQSEFKDSFQLAYRLIDSYHSVQLDTANYKLNVKDTLLNNFIVGGKSYSNVLLNYNDTNTIFRTNYTEKIYIWKTYYSNNKGIIAFFDRLTNSIFYLVD